MHLCEYLQEKVYGKPIIVADREMVEEKADDMLLDAQVSDVAFLVVGDPFGYFFFPLLSFIPFSLFPSEL